MICPHCSHENPEGRKYCRACAKPLAAVTVLEPSASSQPPRIAPSKPLLNKMALASLILSLFSLIVPFGIAAPVLGHVSRNQISKSKGRLRGMGVAFGGLILGYLQVPVGSITRENAGIAKRHNGVSCVLEYRAHKFLMGFFRLAFGM